MNNKSKSKSGNSKGESKPGLAILVYLSANNQFCLMKHTIFVELCKVIVNF